MCQTPINEQVNQITRDVLSNATGGREIAVAIEANQVYVDYLDWLKDNLPPIDLSVTVAVGDTQIKFKNDEDFANWLSELIS